MSKKSSYTNRGKNLEIQIEFTNSLYARRKLAIVQKVPTEWNITRKGFSIVSAFPVRKSTVDFVGIQIGGRGIAFDAKSTKNKTSFPLSNIEQHQIDFLQDFKELGGIAFLLVYFELHNRAFVLMIDDLIEYMATASRKSIPFLYFEMYTKEVHSTTIPLDYLGALK